MKAMVVKQIGSADVFECTEYPVPAAKPGHMVIEVKASSVNPLDVMLRSSENPWSENRPDILHGDVAGVVHEVGEGISGFKTGDEVYGCAGGVAGQNGALADYMLVDAELMAKKPESLSMGEAAALPLVSITAWEGLHDKLKVTKGDRVLIHGATGGVGHIAIQLARHFGATVTATTKPRTLDVAAGLGADYLINVLDTSVQEYVRQFAGGVGYDKVFDTVVGENIKNSFEAVRFNGEIAVTLPVDDTFPVLMKSLSLHGVLMLIPLFHGINRSAHGRILTEVAQLVDKGVIKPLIDPHSFTIWQVADAHRHLESRQALGKIVLTAD